MDKVTKNFQYHIFVCFNFSVKSWHPGTYCLSQYGGGGSYMSTKLAGKKWSWSCTALALALGTMHTGPNTNTLRGEWLMIFEFVCITRIYSRVLPWGGGNQSPFWKCLSYFVIKYTSCPPPYVSWYIWFGFVDIFYLVLRNSSGYFRNSSGYFRNSSGYFRNSSGYFRNSSGPWQTKRPMPLLTNTQFLSIFLLMFPKTPCSAFPQLKAITPYSQMKSLQTFHWLEATLIAYDGTMSFWAQFPRY